MTRPTRRAYGEAEAARALLRLSRQGILKYNDLEAPLRRAVVLHWGGMSAARDALGLARPLPPRQLWSRKRVLDEIRALARAGRHLSMSALRDAGRHDLLIAARKYAGGWTRARQLAGVRFRRQRSQTTAAWDAAAVIAEIDHRRSTGHELAVTKVPRALVSAAQRTFGSWRAAIEAAGIDYDSIVLGRTYDDDALLTWLRRLARRNPQMSPFEIDQHGEHAVACRRRWGSYEAAATAAGLTGWLVRKRHPAVSRKEVMRKLRERYATGASMSHRAVESSRGGSTLITSVFHHFPTWNDALAAADVPTVHRVHDDRRAVSPRRR